MYRLVVLRDSERNAANVKITKRDKFDCVNYLLIDVIPANHTASQLLTTYARALKNTSDA